MLLSIALIFLVGLASSALCARLRLPGIIGMLLTGILLGPHLLNLLDPSLLAVSADLREMALVIILLKAGLSLDLSDLKKVGRPAVLMSFLPASFEILGIVLLGPALLGLTTTQAAIAGAVLGAVSPAVVVPRMVKLIESGYGTREGIPQMIMAAASCDDVFVIVLFSTFVGIEQGSGARLLDLMSVPVSILTGLAAGAAAGWLLSRLFEAAFCRGRMIRNSTKVVILLGCAFLLTSGEDLLSGILPFSGLLAVLAMACVIRRKEIPAVFGRLSEKMGKLWIAAELLLFTLVGAAVDIRYTLRAGLAVILLIFGGLAFRCAGVLLSLAGTSLRRQERFFCVIAYLPKATVQAAIGAVPLSLGLSCGSLVLTLAVAAILITAPLGAVGIDLSCRRLLRAAAAANSEEAAQN